MRPWFRRLHRWLGLGGGALVVFSCLTGSLLVFHHELDAWLNRELRQAQPGPLLSAETVLSKVATGPGERVTRLYFPQADENYKLRLQKGSERRHLYLSRHDGQLLGEADPRVANLIQLHRQLWAGDPGRWLVTLGALLFLSSQLTGLRLAWPKRLQDWKASLSVSTVNRSRLLYDLHRVVGFYTVTFLCLIALTGLLFSPLKAPLVKLLGAETSKPQSQSGQDIGLDKAAQAAQQAFPDAQLDAVNLPRKEQDPYHFFLRHRGQPGRAGRSWVYVDRHTGQVLAQEHALKRSPLQALLKTWAFPLHTGNALGIGHQLLWLVVVLLGATLPLTGIALWLRRRQRRKSSSK